jgi:hypothetical protein
MSQSFTPMVRVVILTSPPATCSCKATCLRCRSDCDVVCCCRGGVFLLVVAVRCSQATLIWRLIVGQVMVKFACEVLWSAVKSECKSATQSAVWSLFERCLEAHSHDPGRRSFTGLAAIVRPEVLGVCRIWLSPRHLPVNVGPPGLLFARLHTYIIDFSNVHLNIAIARLTLFAYLTLHNPYKLEKTHPQRNTPFSSHGRQA